jgi:ferrochelatase
MRYWHPFIEDSLKDIEKFSPDQCIVLPLYPQFSSTTTLSAIDVIKNNLTETIQVKFICCYSKNTNFIDAHVDLIKKSLENKDLTKVRVLFSAHGLPEKIVSSGDSYQEQIESTVDLIIKKLSSDLDYEICYQSRVGPLKWIGPATDDRLKKAGTEKKDIVLVPIAFVSEHIETLVELDIEYQELAHHNGVKNYDRVPALGIHPLFIKALGEEVIAAICADSDIIGDYNCANCHKLCPKHFYKKG